MTPISRSIACRQALRTAFASTTLLLTLSGCKSEYDRQVEQARAAAASTGQAQEVISVDKDGKTTVTVVQPSGVPGAQPVVSTTSTPAGAVAIATGQPDWSNGARPAPGNTVTFAGPKMAPAETSTAPVAPGSAVAPVAPPSASSANPSGANVAAATVIANDVTVPAGTGLAIRINQTISVKHSHAGDRFTGELAEAVVNNGHALLPRGTRVSGIVTEAHRRGHFKGRSSLGLRLTSLAFDGTTYPITTGSLNRTKKGKGKRTAAFIGTGAGVGMLVGGLATGGVGLAVGGLAGGGLGTLLGGVTGNRDIAIPAESLVRFRLEDDLVVQAANAALGR